MTKWTVPPVSSSNKSRRISGRTYAREHNGAQTRYKIKIKPREPKLLYRGPYHMELYINGVRLKVVTRQHVAKFLGVQYNTVQAWYKQGIFGEPFLVDRDPRGFERQFWLVPQMICFIRVLNEILRQGYLSIQWSKFEEQVEAIHSGMDRHAKIMAKKLDKGVVLGDTRNRFGVELLD